MHNSMLLPRPLLSLVVLGFLLSLANAVQEQIEMVSALLIGLLSVSGVATATGFYCFLSKRFSMTFWYLKFVCYLSATTIVLMMLFYLKQGIADSLDTAGHMHVLVFPIVHILLTIILAVVAGLLDALVARMKNHA